MAIVHSATLIRVKASIARTLSTFRMSLQASFVDALYVISGSLIYVPIFSLRLQGNIPSR